MPEVGQSRARGDFNPASQTYTSPQYCNNQVLRAVKAVILDTLSAHRDIVKAIIALDILIFSRPFASYQYIYLASDNPYISFAVRTCYNC